MWNYFFFFSETIFGYKNLKIKIVYSEASGHCLVKIFYTSKVNSYGLVADDLWAKLTPALPEDFARDYYYFGLRHRAENIVSKCFGTPKYQFFRAYGKTLVWIPVCFNTECLCFRWPCVSWIRSTVMLFKRAWFSRSTQAISNFTLVVYRWCKFHRLGWPKLGNHLSVCSDSNN